MPFYEHLESIGAGYDVPLVDLDLITSLSVSGIAFLPLLTPAKYRRAEKRIKANGAPDRSGFKTKKLLSGLMTLAQFEYLIATYEGPVTMYAWLTLTTPVRFNAMLDMGDQEDYEPADSIRDGWSLQNVVWSLSKIEVLA